MSASLAGGARAAPRAPRAARPWSSRRATGPGSAARRAREVRRGSRRPSCGAPPYARLPRLARAAIPAVARAQQVEQRRRPSCAAGRRRAPGRRCAGPAPGRRRPSPGAPLERLQVLGDGAGVAAGDRAGEGARRRGAGRCPAPRRAAGRAPAPGRRRRRRAAGRAASLTRVTRWLAPWPAPRGRAGGRASAIQSGSPPRSATRGSATGRAGRRGRSRRTRRPGEPVAGPRRCR